MHQRGQTGSGGVVITSHFHLLEYYCRCASVAEEDRGRDISLIIAAQLRASGVFNRVGESQGTALAPEVQLPASSSRGIKYGLANR